MSKVLAEATPCFYVFPCKAEVVHYGTAGWLAKNYVGKPMGEYADADAAAKIVGRKLTEGICRGYRFPNGVEITFFPTFPGWVAHRPARDKVGGIYSDPNELADALRAAGLV